jgi:hypothetical protein
MTPLIPDPDEHDRRYRLSAAAQIGVWEAVEYSEPVPDLTMQPDGVTLDLAKVDS